MRLLRHTFRFVFGATTCVSLFVCVFAICFWVRSYFIADVLEWWGTETSGGLVSYDGRLQTAFDSSPRHNLITLPGGFVIPGGVAPPGYEFDTVHPPDPSRVFTTGIRDPGIDVAGLRVHHPVEYYSMMNGDGTTRGTWEPLGDWLVLIPYWQIVALTGLLPTVALLLAWRRRLRLLRGKCRKCGYDLRASIGSCPECGARHAPAVPFHRVPRTEP